MTSFFPVDNCFFLLFGKISSPPGDFLLCPHFFFLYSSQWLRAFADEAGREYGGRCLIGGEMPLSLIMGILYGMIRAHSCVCTSPTISGTGTCYAPAPSAGKGEYLRMSSLFSFPALCCRKRGMINAFNKYNYCSTFLPSVATRQCCVFCFVVCCLLYWHRGRRTCRGCPACRRSQSWACSTSQRESVACTHPDEYFNTLRTPTATWQ